MRVLFSMLHPGYARNYEGVIRLLAQRGHQVHLVFDTLHGGKHQALLDDLARRSADISYATAALPPRVDLWSTCLKLLRAARDHLRYRAPEYRGASRLRERSLKGLPRPVRLALRACGWLAGAPGSRVLGRWLEAAELALPPDPLMEQRLRSLDPDVVLVTPLVQLVSAQKNHLRAAQRAGCPVALCVHSWDNLTNKGLIGPWPDRVILWNEAQKDEAVQLHGVPAERVRVTGAQCYDRWFEQPPSTTREEFCARAGLDPQRPFVLWVCSSGFIAGNDEPELVRRWLAGIREFPQPTGPTGPTGRALREIGVLVRPHPQRAARWRRVDFATLGNVAIFPRDGANPVDERNRAEFFDSLFHSAAVVGINTSAMIEAGIVGRPVLTWQPPELAGSQAGTLHFQHLVAGGLVHTNDRLDEHLRQLADAVAGRLDGSAARCFVASFVRPLGADRPAAPEVVRAIEELAGRPLAPQPPPRLAPLLRAVLFAPALLAGWAERGWPRKWVRRSGRLARGARRRASRLLGLGGAAASAEKVEPTTPREVRAELQRLASSSLPIVVGPWLSEVGFQVLYWVPFLNWVRKEVNLAPERLVVVAHGGTGCWYGDLAGRYVDILDLFSPEEFRTGNRGRIEATGGQKQQRITEFDAEILDRVRQRLGVAAVDVLHPSMMYNLFTHYWRAKAPLELIDEHTEFGPFPAPPRSADDLPAFDNGYVAVKFYWSACFPDRPENRAFVARTVRALAARTDVVLLDTGLELDDHRDCDPAVEGRIHRIHGRVVPSRNLELQSGIVAQAKAFVGTYGGFSYLAASYGVPALAIYSEPGGFLPTHLRVAERAYRRPPFAPLRLADARDVDGVSWVWSEPAPQLRDAPPVAAR